MYKWEDRKNTESSENEREKRERERERDNQKRHLLQAMEINKTIFVGSLKLPLIETSVLTKNQRILDTNINHQMQATHSSRTKIKHSQQKVSKV